MADNTIVESRNEPLIPRYIVSITTFICAGVFMTLALLGPLGIGIIQFRTSQSGIWQTVGQDLADLLLMTPILVIGGILHIMKRDSAKYFLIIPPITLIYTGLTYGIGQEWSNPAYIGNVERYSWLFMTLIIGGIILGISSLSMFTEEDVPEFKTRGLQVYVGIMSIFLLIFAIMWISELVEVLTTGDTSTGSYQNTPTVWWVIRYFDLGITIPLGIISLYLLLTKPKQAYPLILLFFGFFITLGTAVNTMGWVMYLNADPELQPASLIIFSVLAILAYGGLFYLIKSKLPWYNK